MYPGRDILPSYRTCPSEAWKMILVSKSEGRLVIEIINEIICVANALFLKLFRCFNKGYAFLESDVYNVRTSKRR